MGDLSKNFSLREFENSDIAIRLGIDNRIKSDEVKKNIQALVDNVLQPLRDAFKSPIFINSGYRCLKLNEAVGGVPTSQHVLGCAADCGCNDPYALAKLALWKNLEFDQLIVYPTFVHLSYRRDGRNRGEVLYNEKWKGPRDL